MCKARDLMCFLSHCPGFPKEEETLHKKRSQAASNLLFGRCFQVQGEGGKGWPLLDTLSEPC